MTPIPKFLAGGRAAAVLLVAGGGLVTITLLDLIGSSRRLAAFSYLFAFAYWASFAIGALLVVAGFHASKARWAVALRRVVEALALQCVPLALLFVPVALLAPLLFTWFRPPPDAGAQFLAAIHHKAPYLNMPFFVVRAVLYFARWGGAAWFLWRWSHRQDDAPNGQLTQRQWVLSAATLPFAVLALSFAGLDWVLSLEPLSYSTMFGFYYLAGAMLCATAAMSAILCFVEPAGFPTPLLGHAHFVSLGKLLLAATAFWAYIAFCQYMLTWIADISDEIPWFYVRTKGAWRDVAVALAVGQFLIPFFALLSRELKISRAWHGGLAVWVLCFHALDVYWLVMPALHPDGPWVRWTDFTAFFGVGALLAGFSLWALRGGYAVPVGDPYLRHSLRYEQI